jgi:nitroreductase
MTFEEVIAQRSSKRDFLDRDVSDELVEKVLKIALTAPSSSNTQPYRVAVAKGQTRDSIRNSLTYKFVKANQVKRMSLPKKVWHGVTGNVLPDGDFKNDTNYPKELKQRAVACGMGLYETLGIVRNDYAARDRQMQRNFEFFDAPVAMFIYMHGERGVYGALDAGIFLQTLMLAATSQGLGTCAQAALAIWASPVREHFNIDKDYKLICGLSMGYPSEHIVNQFQPEKCSVADLCFDKRQGFPGYSAS